MTETQQLNTREFKPLVQQRLLYLERTDTDGPFHFGDQRQECLEVAVDVEETFRPATRVAEQFPRSQFSIIIRIIQIEIDGGRDAAFGARYDRNAGHSYIDGGSGDAGGSNRPFEHQFRNVFAAAVRVDPVANVEAIKDVPHPLALRKLP